MKLDYSATRPLLLFPPRARATRGKATSAPHFTSSIGQQSLGVGKRTIDVVVSSVGLVLLTPLFALVAILIKATDQGPILYWQDRVGLCGKEFRFPKFRSMVTNADAQRSALQADNAHGDSITFKIKRDPRITWIGKYLRKFSIDELPQLWCVLRGDMSLVGPRPAIPSEVALYTESDRRRLEAVPGLTCLWQVSGRADIPFKQQVELDVKYIESQNVILDLWLLLRTIPAVLLAKGAY